MSRTDLVFTTVKPFDLILRFVVSLGLICSQPSTVCFLTMPGSGGHPAGAACCADGPVRADAASRPSAAPSSAAPGSSAASASLACGHHGAPGQGQETRCERACCTPIGLQLARAFDAGLELSPLGFTSDRGDVPHGIVISPVPRPPPGDAA